MKTQVTSSNSKLISALQSFTNKELNLFHKFINSPFYIQNQYIIKLFEIIKKQKPDYQLDKNQVFKRLYPGKPYNDLRLRHLLSELYKLLEEFMTTLQINKKQVSKKIYLLEHLNDRGLDKHFMKVKSEVEKLQKKNIERDQSYYFDQFRLESEIGRFIESQKNRSLEPNLQEMVDNLDIFYFLTKLKMACVSESYRNLVDIEYRQDLLDQIVKMVADRKFQDNPSIQIYYNILMTLRDSENEAHFFRLKLLLFENAHLFSVQEAGDMFVLARNYCIKKINKGFYEYFKEVYEFYKFELEHGVLLDNGFISPFSYKNIVSAGLKLNDHDWIESFIHQYKEHLEEEYRDTMFTYNLAKLFFAKRNYDDVISLLHNTEYHEMFLNLDTKVMLIKTYYELQELNPLESLMDSFRIFLLRKRKLSYHRPTYINFLKFLKKIIITRRDDEARIGKIKEEIESTREVIDKGWLLEKLAET